MGAAITDKGTMVRVLATSSKEEMGTDLGASLNNSLSRNPNLLKAIRAFIYQVCYSGIIGCITVLWSCDDVIHACVIFATGSARISRISCTVEH